MNDTQAMNTSEMTHKDIIEQVLKPTVRIRTGKATGSGSIVKSDGEGTYILTNRHVVDDAIEYKNVWDELLRREIKKEFTKLVEVDIPKINKQGNQYALTTSQAEIILSNSEQDLALLRLKDEDTHPTIRWYPKDEADKIPILSWLACCGAAMGEKPIVTYGHLNGIGIEIDNYEYDLSSAPSIFGNCLPGDAVISMADGTCKYIKDIEPGEYVLGYGERAAGLAPAEVLEVIESGVKEIIRVKTRNRTIRASGNHPVVKIQQVQDFAGRIRNIPVWTRLDSLKEGDLIAVMRHHIPRSKPTGFNFAQAIGQNNDPQDLMRFLGFFVGDGYKRIRPNSGGEVCLYPYDQALARQYKDILETLFGVNVSVIGDWDGLRVSSVELACKLESWGFSGTSATKEIPSWVMTCRPEDQLAFLQGYVEADGHINRSGAWHIEATSKKLVEQLRMMSIHIGLQVSNIYYRKRTVSPRPGYSYEAETWSFQIYPEYARDINSFFEGDKSLLPDDLQYVRVTSIEVEGEEMTYDLKLGRRHAFFADGALVHNSGGAVFTPYNGSWHFIGIPSRITVAFLGFSADAITHMGYFIPIRRIYKWLTDNCYEFLWGEKTKEECDKAREEKRQRELALALARERA